MRRWPSRAGRRYVGGVSSRIWCNADVTQAEIERLCQLANGGRRVAELADADVAFGQPSVEACRSAPDLRWVHLNSAGWDKFATPRVSEELEARGLRLTTSSEVYREPCAQHVLAFLLAEARQLGRSFAEQATDRTWSKLETRAACRLLGPEVTVALVGFGSIAARVAELLAPFGARVVGVRRSPRGRETVAVEPLSELPRVLGQAQHVVNILPGGESTGRAFGPEQFAAMRDGAVFYNIGRGSTVDQTALLSALASGRLRAAYLDVTDPEPLPADHPLWRARGCHITPHAAGGHASERERLVGHFEANLRRYVAGEALVDRVL